MKSNIKNLIIVLAVPILISGCVGPLMMGTPYSGGMMRKQASSHNPNKETLKNDSSQLSPLEHSTIHNSNHNPIVKIKKKTNISKLAKISEQEAIHIVLNMTDEEPKSIQLIHKSNYVAYEVITTNHIFTINALDATLMDKKRLKREDGKEGIK